MPHPGTVWAADTWDADAWAADTWATAQEGSVADTAKFLPLMGAGSWLLLAIRFFGGRYGS